MKQKVWPKHDTSLPEYACESRSCSEHATFLTPTLAKTSHETKCGNCGKDYYSCDLGFKAFHNIWIKGSKCHITKRLRSGWASCLNEEGYWKCMGHKHIWSITPGTEPEVTEPPETQKPSLSPSTGSSNTAYAGNPYTVQLSILSKAASIEFYVITPNDAINDVSTFLGTASGDGTSTAATMTYTFPSGVSGDYTFYVSIGYNDGTSESPQPSYTVSVSLPSSTETTTSTETPSSTPEPEPTTTCGGCSETVSSSTQHSATCASGHSYWSCKPNDVSLHRTRTCRLSTCGKSWERCSTPGGTPLCNDPGRRSRGLPCWKKE